MATYLKVEKEQVGDQNDWLKIIREYSFDINTNQTTCSQKMLLPNNIVKCGTGIAEEGNQEDTMYQQDLNEGWSICSSKEWDNLTCTQNDLEWDKYYNVNK